MSQIPQCQSLNIYDVNKQGPKKICVCSTCFFQSFNVTKHLYIHLLSVDVFCCQAQTNRQTTQKKTTQTCRFQWVQFPRDVQCSDVMQKNVCDFPNFKGESPPHPRTIAPTSWDPNTAEPTLAPWRLTSCHGAGDENGVSAPLSHRCRRHSSPCEGWKPLGGSEKSGTPSWRKRVGLEIIPWIYIVGFLGWLMNTSFEIWWWNLEFLKYQQQCMVYLPTVASSFMVHVCKCT